MSDSANGKEFFPKEYMAIADCAKKWKLTSKKLTQLCEEGKIAGVSNLSGAWIIPIHAEKPIIESRLPDTIIPKNMLQEAALEHVEEGVPFGVHEYAFDKITFIVSGVFQRQGATPEEKIASLITHDIAQETGHYFPAKVIEEIKKEVCKNSNAANVTFDDYMYAYLKRLKSYGFSDEDIEMLLEKIAADYEPFIL